MPTFEISVPPSVNEMYVNRNCRGRRGRMISPKYLAWLEGEKMAMLAQKAKPVQTPVLVSILKPSKSRQDIDASLKPTLDLLTKCGVIPDDNPKYVR